MRRAAAENFFEEAHILDPYPFYEGMWNHDPAVSRIPGSDTYIVFSAELVREVCRRTEDFSNDLSKDLIGKRAGDPDVRAVSEQGWPFASTLISADPPHHARARKMVVSALGKKKIDSILPEIRSLTKTLIDEFAARGRCEFMSEFAIPLPIKLISSQIGLGDVPVQKIKDWSDAITDRAGGMIDKDREVECARLIVEYQHTMFAEIERRRDGRRENDILQFLLDASAVSEDEPLSDEEMLSVLQQLMVGGNETTTSTLGGGMLHLCENPGVIERVRAEPTLLPKLVEEILRLETAAQGVWRKATRETELAGISIPAGAMVMVRLGAANRDPSLYEDAAGLCPHRSGLNRHLSFGSGIHVCVGHFLARAELAIAFGEIFDRLTNIRVQDNFEPSYPCNVMVRGPVSLPIIFDER